ncbi:E3 ubiquitin-protein ligase RNF217-like [Nematostella vectensis]|uniref:E3 ubiquitin-protein ligase RNF217-like n=1 Tax=Nematostella vectensis TaxID=45351 RepID=UPI0020772AF2|nr:E3 ubiquitin-protein ligase RNF217-like [Nematostella vectensis]
MGDGFCGVFERLGVEPRYDCVFGIYDFPCFVCFLHGSSSNAVMLRDCCKGTICKNCLECHIGEKVSQGIVKIICPLEDCDRILLEDEIQTIASEEIWRKYEKFKTDIEQNPNIKTCPNCSRIYRREPVKQDERVNEKQTETKTKTKEKNNEDCKVVCRECKFVWCYDCQAPWHYGISCKEFCQGDKSLKIWAKNRGAPTRNATRCPKCQVFIQKKAGCDHITCSRCMTEFCYQCGRRFRGIRFLGDHHDPLSVFGCKYNYKPDNPTQRMAARCAVLSAKVLALPLMAGVAAGAGCVVLGAGVVIAPAYVSYKMIKKKKKPAMKAYCK